MNPSDLSNYHIIFGLAGFVIGLWGTAIYIASIFRGQTKPHVYTHLVWGIITAIAFFAQVYDHAGPGCWPIGLTAAACLFQSGLALKYGEKNITRGDRLALLMSFIAIAAWIVTKDPLLSVILACVIDGIAFIPTFRKSWLKPWEENLAAYNIANIKLALSLIALTHVTFITALYPAVAFSVNALFVAGCLWRRKILKITPPLTAA